MNTFAVAGVQMLVHFGHDNVPAMREQLDVVMLRFPWVEMVVFSELCAFGASLPHAQTMPGPAENAFCEMARKHNVWLIPGSIFEKRDGLIYNTAPVIDPAGTVIARHRKMFPFRPYEAGVTGGTEFVVFDVPLVGRFGLSICYDMWFPETSRTLAAMGAEVLIHPTLTNTIDRNIELSIGRATAAINQMFLVDVNGLGSGGYGRSLLVRPTGNVVYEAGAGPELIPISIDLDAVRAGRASGTFGLGQQLKSFRDRAVDFTVYQKGGPGDTYLAGLGPLAMPTRPQRKGSL